MNMLLLVAIVGLAYIAAVVSVIYLIATVRRRRPLITSALVIAIVTVGSFTYAHWFASPVKEWFTRETCCVLIDDSAETSDEKQFPGNTP